MGLGALKTAWGLANGCLSKGFCENPSNKGLTISQTRGSIRAHVAEVVRMIVSCTELRAVFAYVRFTGSRGRKEAPPLVGLVVCLSTTQWRGSMQASGGRLRRHFFLVVPKERPAPAPLAHMEYPFIHIRLDSVCSGYRVFQARHFTT